MKIWVYVVERNEIEIVGYFLRHYNRFADRIIVYDDDSDDGTLEKCKSEIKVEVREWPMRHCLDDNYSKELSESAYKEARGKADWIIWADIDEFYHPAPEYPKPIDSILLDAQYQGFDSVRVEGFNMMNEGLPPDDGISQLTDLIKKGVRAPVHAKQVVFRPHLDMHWSTGRHQMECSVNATPDVRILNCHYRFLGYQYTKARNQRNLVRLTPKNRNHGWSNEEWWKGEHSPEWAAQALKDAVPVIL